MAAKARCPSTGTERCAEERKTWKEAKMKITTNVRAGIAYDRCGGSTRCGGNTRCGGSTRCGGTRYPTYPVYEY